MEFLYFPENKLEYIPSVIMLIIFVIGAIYAMRFIKKMSAKELEKTKHLEARIMEQNQQEKNVSGQEDR